MIDMEKFLKGELALIDKEIAKVREDGAVYGSTRTNELARLRLQRNRFAIELGLVKTRNTRSFWRNYDITLTVLICVLLLFQLAQFGLAWVLGA